MLNWQSAAQELKKIMKQIIILLATVFIAFTGYAQENRAFFSGDGLSNSTAYEIRTPAQLARLAELVNSGDEIANAFFKLTVDIDLSAYGSNWNSGKGWIPIGTASSAFTGHFNGNNHTVSGLYINDSELDFAGLFGVISFGGIVQNLSVEVNITGGNHVDGVAGQSSGTITNCYAASEVSGIDIIGSVVGDLSYNGLITSCYAAGVGSGIASLDKLMGTPTVLGTEPVAVLKDNKKEVKSARAVYYMKLMTYYPTV